MDLRYQLAVVAGAGGAHGRAVAVALARRGAAVVCADRELRPAEETAALARQARVAAWSIQADVREDVDRRLLIGRASDLGGGDLLVDAGASGEALTALFVAALAGRPRRPGRPGASPAAVRVGPDPDVVPLDGGPVRLMAVVVGSPPPEDTAVARAVVDLLAHGSAGQVVHVHRGMQPDVHFPRGVPPGK